MSLLIYLFTFSTRSFNVLIIIILNSLLDRFKTWFISGSGSDDFLIPPMVYILFCFFLSFNFLIAGQYIYKTIGDWDKYYFCLEIGVIFFCYIIRMEVWVNLVSTWTGFVFCGYYHYLQHTTNLNFLYGHALATLCLVWSLEGYMPAA